jgi:hypothetical protein
MATQPKPKPKPEPEPPEPKPEEDDAAGITGEDSLERLHERLDALFTSQTALIDRVEKLEERVAAPPIGLGRRP